MNPEHCRFVTLWLVTFQTLQAPTVESTHYLSSTSGYNDSPVCSMALADKLFTYRHAGRLSASIPFPSPSAPTPTVRPKYRNRS